MKLQKIPEPIGSFILKQSDIKPVMGQDGAYPDNENIFNTGSFKLENLKNLLNYE